MNKSKDHEYLTKYGVVALLDILGVSSLNIEECKKIHNKLHEIIPTSLSVCNAHTIIAVCRWVKSNDRPQCVRADNKALKAMLLNLFRNGTKTLSLAELIVHLGLMIFILETPFLEVERNNTILARHSPDSKEILAIEQEVACFVRVQTREIKNSTKDFFTRLDQDETLLSTIANINVSTQLVNSVLFAARRQKLRFSVTYCCKEIGEEVSLKTSICYGVLSSFKNMLTKVEMKKFGDRAEYAQMALDNPKPRWIKNFNSTTSFSDVSAAKSATVLIRNPVNHSCIVKYLRENWIPVSMKEKLRTDDFLDVEHHTRSNKLLQDHFDGVTPRRRFESLLVSGPHVYNGENGKVGIGKGVIRCYRYPSHQTRPNCNRCRPMRNLDYAFVLTIWELAWEYLTEYSRMNPPTTSHLLIYLGVVKTVMARHRDNFKSTNIAKLKKGLSPENSGTYKGSRNSQVDTSSVIIFSKGNRPMVIRMSYGATPDHLGDKREDYVTSFAYQMTCADGWITVLDPLDDLMMRHELEFAVETTEEDEYPPLNECYRDAWVIRWLKEEADFFVDTCGLRISEEMEEDYGKDISIDEEFPHYVRGIFT